MPLVFIVFCSSEDSHSNIEHSTVHEMQCIKKASGKIYNMQYFRIEEQHKFWQCMCSATRTVLMLLHNEYFLLFTNEIHTACSAPYVQVGSYQHEKHTTRALLAYTIH